MPSPDLLVTRAIEGDRHALEELLRKEAPALREGLSIAPLWRRSFDVEDVLQVTYLEAFLRIGTLRERDENGFRRWLRRIAQNNLVDAIRALERDRRPDPRERVTQGAEGASSRTLLARVAAKTAGPSRGLSLREEMERLQAAIAQLPASYRMVVERVDLGECSVRELAEELRRSLGAIHMLRTRALERLQELLAR